MANPNADIIEEDAADLQFPKVWTSNDKQYEELCMPVERKEIFTSDSTCFTCKCFISEPYIRCAVCEFVLLCPPCFAKGREKDSHKNYHDYMIVRNDFPLIQDSGWTAKEEKSLLELVQECGFGNWVDVSRRLTKRSPEECKRHYLQYYIDKQSLSGLPQIKETLTSLFGPEPIPYAFKLSNLDDPPRFGLDTINYKLMAGYNAARSDFEINFDNHAELMVANLKYDAFTPEDPCFKLGRELQVAIMGAYNMRLKERARRCSVIREHGLISSRRIVSYLAKYDATITRSLSERLRIFKQLVRGIEYDAIIECMHRIGELKNYLNQLIHYRKNGIKYFHSVAMFENLSKIRYEFEKEQKQFMNCGEYNWQNIVPTEFSENMSGTTAITKRKTAPPLELLPTMMGYEKLTASEKQLCSVVRIFPDVYIELKNLLLNENKKYGSVKLAQARQILKIDVNKTKKIHEFLVNEGYININ